MDAHPNLVVAHQVDLFEKDERGDVTDRLAFADRDAALGQLIQRAAVAAATGRRGQRLRPDGSDYYSSYEVPGGWQGRFEDLRAVGTKNAVESALVAERFGVAPLRALETQLDVPVRFVHVVRDPYDNIATMRLEHGERAIGRWRRRAEGVAVIKDAGFPVLDVHLEDLIADPRRQLAAVCAHYDVAADDEYLDRCSAIVAEQPNRTGAGAVWSDAEQRAIESLIDEYPWLARYRRRSGWQWVLDAARRRRPQWARRPVRG